MIKEPYLFEDGSDVSSLAFLFESLLGAGAALFGVASGAGWHAEHLPFGARDSAVGEA